MSSDLQILLYHLSDRSDEGLTLETSAFFYFLRWLIYVFNPVVNTKLPAILSHRRSTTVSLETYPLIHLSEYLFVILLPDCGSVLNNTLKSPNYPEGYPDNMECEFKVPIPSGFRLKITFENMMLPDLRSYYQCV